MRSIINKICAGLVISVIGGLIFFLIGHTLSFAIDEDIFGGDKAGVVWAIVFGMPLGSVIGFLVIDKFLYHYPRNNVLGMIIGFFCGSVFVIIGGGFLLDLMGWKAIPIILLLVVCFCLTGYQIGLKTR